MKTRNLFRFGLIVLTVLSVFILVSCGGGTAIPSGSNQATVNGNTGTSSAGIPVQCNQAVGNVHIPAGSFSGTETVKIECLSSGEAQELDSLVKKATKQTNEVLGAIKLEPSPFDFNKDVELVIPLLTQRLDLKNTPQDLYVYAPDVSSDLRLVSQAMIDGVGWSGTANVEHFSTFILVGPSATTPPSGGSTTPQGSIEIPAGEFLMGSNSGDPQNPWSGEMPQHSVTLDTYWIDKTETTNAMYTQCIEKGACTPPSQANSATRDSYYGNPEFDNYPVIYVDWNQAKTYCEWAGGRLPTEAEWEKAARDSDARIYPWGENISCDLANYKDCVNDTVAVGSYPGGASPYGVMDMAGNVWEWTADWMGESYYSQSPQSNPLGPDSGDDRVVRGGAWYFEERDVRSASRGGVNPVQTDQGGGFRCVYTSSSGNSENSELVSLTYDVFITQVAKDSSGVALASELYSPGIPTELTWEGQSPNTVVACNSECRNTMEIPANQSGRLIARNDSWGTCTVEGVTLAPNDGRVFTIQWWQVDQILDCSLE